MNLAKTSFKKVLPYLERFAHGLDQTFSRFIQPRRKKGDLILQNYIGWGTPTEIELGGRVLLPRTLSPVSQTTSRYQNMMNIVRRLMSREVGGIEVVGELAGQTVQAVSDSDGFFVLKFKLDTPLKVGWHDAILKMKDRDHEIMAQVQVTGQPEMAIISDLDDTVIQSGVTSIPRMLSTVFFGNSRTRAPFPGVGAFYQALTHTPEGRNPIFYVSSSPWNFFDLLWQFLDYRKIPLGPLFLRNWGMDLLKGHGGYKHGVIKRIFDQFPDLKFILVGDSGEKDPEIYAEVVKQYPDRVLAVYIRDVTDSVRDQNVLKLREEVGKAGIELVLTADSLTAAGHALAMGFITPAEYKHVLESASRERLGEVSNGL